MEISLREWLIIGGILVIALILFDGWRRIRGNRSRIRMDIDRSAVNDHEPEGVSLSNPELPNGGARRIADEEERREPAFTPEPVSRDAESDRIPDWTPKKRSAPVERQPDLLDDAEPELDPLFDDVPVGHRRPAVAQRVPQPEIPETADPQASVQTSAEAGESSADTKSSQSAAEAPLTARRDDDEAAEPEPLSLDFDPEQPIPVLMDRVRPSAERKSATPTEPKRATPEPALEPEPTGDDSSLGEALTLNFDEPEAQDSEPEEPQAHHPQASAAPEESNSEADAGDRVAQSEKKQRAAPEISADPEEMLVIFVVARQGQTLPGAAIHRIADACGMEIGAMDIYHRHEHPNAQGSLQFSMANAIQPGTFDLDSIDQLETPAVTFFMSMRDPADPMYAYECMLATAETLARHLEAEMLDGDRSVMRPQTKEHYRERIRDFEIHKRVRRAH